MSSKGVNRVIIVGHLGNDPETRHTGNGTAITSISVATSESWTDKQSGEKQERTEWHRVKMFGRLAEIAGEYLTKGRQVYIEGQLRTDKYTDKEGIERYATDIIANEMQMLGTGQQDGGDGQRRAPSQGNQQRANGNSSRNGNSNSNNRGQEAGRQSNQGGNGGRSNGNGNNGYGNRNGNGQSGGGGNGSSRNSGGYSDNAGHDDGFASDIPF